MTGAELGFLLLRCRLFPGAAPLSHDALLRLRAQVRAHGRPADPDAPVDAAYLAAIGCTGAEAGQILALLQQRERLLAQLAAWQRRGVAVLSAQAADYPAALSERLGGDAPPALFLRGARGLLRQPCIALVGSRDLRPENAEFARAAGETAARCGLTLVSGNARGADRTAQDACLAAGGSVISIVADRLYGHEGRKNILYISEAPPEVPFSAARALSRNRLIHALGRCVLVAQCREEIGGTWRGTVTNLRRGLAPVYVFDDGSAAVQALCLRGASAVSLQTLSDPAFQAQLRIPRSTPASQ